MAVEQGKIFIGIVSESTKISFNQVKEIAAAINKQVNNEFAALYKKKAPVQAFENKKQLSKDTWGVFIKDNISDNVLGFHSDANGKPFAIVSSDGDVSITCSHEILEMLVDPSGNNFKSAFSLIPTQGSVQYLVEVCDPVEDSFYLINGIKVSNFIVPNFYTLKNDFMNVMKLMPNGYISWMRGNGEWWQAVMSETGVITYYNLGVLNKSANSNWHRTLDALPKPINS